MYDYHESNKKYEELNEIYEVASQKSSEQSRRHSELLNINADYLGWISIKGTRISYPFVQGKDNSFYLTHNFYRELDFAGTIFMDGRISDDGLKRNNIIYGHNMKDKSMFGSLKDFLDSEYFEKNKIITIDRLDGSYKWEIFSVYTTTDTDWLQIDFDDDYEYGQYLDLIQKKSKQPSQAEVNVDDFILTLSTCITNRNDARFIIHAKLIEKDLKNET